MGMTKSSATASVVLAALCLRCVQAFVPLHSGTASSQFASTRAMSDGSPGEPKKKGFFAEFFAELDAFVDDATSRRLGGGSAFYGKRRSSFYGENDKAKKRDRDSFDLSEDYAGPAQAGYFKWMMDEEGQMRPVTRMKEKVVEKRSAFTSNEDIDD